MLSSIKLLWVGGGGCVCGDGGTGCHIDVTVVVVTVMVVAVKELVVAVLVVGVVVISNCLMTSSYQLF